MKMKLDLIKIIEVINQQLRNIMWFRTNKDKVYIQKKTQKVRKILCLSKDYKLYIKKKQ